MLNYNHLYYFHLAATEGSVRAAATKLGVMQSTVSEQLRLLERALEKTLFERSSGGLTLTAAGKHVFEHTTTMFRAAERLVQVLADDPTAPPKTLRVGTSAAVARSTSTDFLLPLFAFDDCVPSIITAEGPELLRMLRANELDLVLCETEPADSALEGLEHAVITHIPLVAIARHDLDPGPDWKSAGLVQYRASSSFYWEVDSFLESESYCPKIVGEADDPSLLVEAAARGGYIVIVPRAVARDALVAGRVRVLAQLDSIRTGVHAVYQDGSSAAVARRAIERLLEVASAP